MIKNIFSVLLGLIVGNIAIMGLHYLGMFFYPLPEGVDVNNPEQLKSYIAIAPLGALLFVMLAHLGGTFLAGIATALVSKNIITAYIVGGFFTLAGIYNLYLLEHPMWFYIEAILYLPAAIYGFNLIAKK